LLQTAAPDRNRRSASAVLRPHSYTGGVMSILWIILIVVLVLVILGFAGRGRL
jgi:flagellar basal body-associated protein FliL